MHDSQRTLEPHEGDSRDMNTRRYCEGIMRAADRHNRNGELTVNELRTYLRGTEYQAFVGWFTGLGTGLGGTFLSFDADANGVITQDTPSLPLLPR